MTPTNTNALLDKARDLCSPPTDYRLAKVLGISNSTISRCRQRGGTLDNEAAARLAAFLEQDFKTVVSLIELDRAKSPKSREFWEKLAPRMVPSLVIGLLAAAPGESGGMSPASHYETPRAVMAMDSLYIMRSTVAALKRWVGRCRKALLDALHAQHPRQLTSLARASAFGVL